MHAMKARGFMFFLLGLASSGIGCRRQLGRPNSVGCDTDGIVSSGTVAHPDAGDLAAEIVQSGCQDCGAKARPGAQSGSPCSAASVCAEACCVCPGSSPRLFYRARVCDSGRCAPPSTACTASRLTLVPDVCGSQ
ncbi:MAG TPA: hypothetical protein VNW92_11085 [Polyangiaceae bacterium]|nr:hypothetical protein [Polyangiaceae bacterium]